MKFLRTALWALIAFGLLCPMFFFLSGHVYNNPYPAPPIYDSGGSLTGVPLPLSLFVCAAAILLFWRRYRAALPALAFGAAFLGAMALTTLSWGLPSLHKLLLLAQFLVPVSGLVLGQMIGRDGQGVRASIWLATLLGVMLGSMLVPLYKTEDLVVSHDLIWFSVYQHRQFVPATLVAGFLVAFFVLWKKVPAIVTLALPVVAFYAVMSLSALAIGLLVLGMAAFVAAERSRGAAMVGLLAALCVAGSFPEASRHQKAAGEKFDVLPVTAPAPARAEGAAAGAAPAGAAPVPEDGFKLPVNVQVRLRDWSLYGRGIVESARTALFGHAQPMDRSVSTSAHNYYLDLAYNFGIIALVPLAYLIWNTAATLWRERARLPADLPLLGLALVVAFLVFADNNFKVTLRQPYPAIFGFFVWGWLLSALRGETHAAR